MKDPKEDYLVDQLKKVTKENKTDLVILISAEGSKDYEIVFGGERERISAILFSAIQDHPEFGRAVYDAMTELIEKLTK